MKFTLNLHKKALACTTSWRTLVIDGGRITPVHRGGQTYLMPTEQISSIMANTMVAFLLHRVKNAA